MNSYGGQYIPEILIRPTLELESAWNQLKTDEAFNRELKELLKTYCGRPTPLTAVHNLGFKQQVFLKREDLLHTGAHKINNALGQCLLAKKIGKKRIIAETGAGQHGVATAAACAKLGLPCVIYMGSIDMERQKPNVERMRLMGATVSGVEGGILKDAINEGLRDWSSSFEETHYCIGSVLGPHPYPSIVRHLQSIISEEIKEVLKPDLMIACIGGGSNAIGFFHHFLEDRSVQMVGVEAEGAARFSKGTPGVLHGSFTYLLQDDEGQVMDTHSISAGLDYPAVGPDHATLFESGRVKYTTISDSEALSAFHLLAKREGILPALESSHALAYFIKIAPQLDEKMTVLINLSGRGDKDIGNLCL